MGNIIDITGMSTGIDADELHDAVLAYVCGVLLNAARAGDYADGYGHSEFYAGCFAGSFAMMTYIEESLNGAEMFANDDHATAQLALKWHDTRDDIMRMLERGRLEDR